VLISNHKGKGVSSFAAKIGVMDDTSFMEIISGRNGLDIRFYCDTVLDMIAKANETISRALALRQVLDWQARRSEPAEREP
jgi:hypothetical protein